MNKSTNRGITRRDALKTTGAAAAAGAVVTGFPALTRSAQQKKFLKPIVAGLNARRAIRPTYRSRKFRGFWPRSTTSRSSSRCITPRRWVRSVPARGGADRLHRPYQQRDGAIPRSSMISFAFVDLPYIITSWDQYLQVAKSDAGSRQAAKFEKNVPVKGAAACRCRGLPAVVEQRSSAAGPERRAGPQVPHGHVTDRDRADEGMGRQSDVDAVDRDVHGPSTKGRTRLHVQPIWTYKFNMFEVLKYATEVKAIFESSSRS